MTLRSYTTMDRVVAALLLAMLLLIVLSWFSNLIAKFLFESAWSLAHSVAICVAMTAWMVKGGATSKLWNWLPPLWPWGYVAKSYVTRWILVAVLIAGAMTGVIVEFLSPIAT